MTRLNIDEDATPYGTVHHICACSGSMVSLAVGTRLSVHLPGDGPEEYWAATPLDAWTCVSCGKTEFFARNPSIFDD